MALLHRADLRPTKLELLNDWLPRRPWYQGPQSPGLQRMATCRFDDPDGQVGVETMLVRAEGGPIMHVPWTYRAAPLDGGEPWFIGTAEHSVLGTRWIYDGCGDPVYVEALARTILTGGTQADEFFDGERERREPSMRVRGSGTGSTHPSVAGPLRITDADPTMIEAGAIALGIVRVLGSQPGGQSLNLTATWDGQPDPVLLAYAVEI